MSFKLLVFKPNNDDIFLIWEKFSFPLVRNKLFILVLFFSRFKLIILSDNSRSWMEPFLIITLKSSILSSFECSISVVKFLIENSLLKLIEASETLPINP